MKQILFVIAMEKEAKDIAESLVLVKIKEKIYRKDNISLLITGIGKQRTAIGLTMYIEQYGVPDCVINIGYVGSTDITIGTWSCVDKSYNYEWYIPGEEQYSICGIKEKDILTLKELPIYPCYSAEGFVTSTKLEGHLLFDMELHSIYLLSGIYQFDVISLKKVSDHLNLSAYYENIGQKEIMELVSGLKILKENGIL